MQDLLTKYSVYASLSNMSAEFTAFVNYFICCFDCSRSITDKDQNFYLISLFMKNIMKKFRIQHFRILLSIKRITWTLAFSSNGIFEVYTRKKNEMKLIERASFVCNISVHEGTRFTPHELIFWIPARIFFSFNLEPDLVTCFYLTNLFIKIREIFNVSPKLT